jgi:selenide, water dikinase
MTKRLVLAGGGHSHLFVLEAFAQTPLPDLEIVLVNRTLHAPYSGMLPGLVAGLYDFDECHIHLESLTQRCNVQFRQTSVVSADLAQRQLKLEDSTTLDYDLLSINTGSTPPLNDTPGAKENVLAIKPIEDFLLGWDAMRAALTQRAKPMRVALVGGGAGSVELALAMQYALRTDARHNLTFEIICDTPDILMTHNAYVRRKFQQILSQRNIGIRANARVVAIEDHQLIFQRGDKMAYDFIVWVTGAEPAAWPRAAGLATDARGFIQINSAMQSTSHPDIFAAGDCASYPEHPRPKSGVYAVRQGPPLARNLHRALNDAPLEAYTPQQRALALISSGDPYAVASWGSLGFAGKWVWRWKDKIDRRFVERFSH